MLTSRNAMALGLVASLLATIFLLSLVAPGDGQQVMPLATSRRPAYAVLFRIYEAWQCRDKKHYMQTYNVSIGADERGSEHVTWFGNFTKPLQTMSKLSIILNRCQGGVSTSLCEYFSTWNWETAVCDLAMMKGVVWTPLVHDALRPKIYCPIKAGPYVMTRGHFDMDAVQKLGFGAGLFNYIWLVEVNVFDEERVLNLCFNGSVAMRRVRLRGRH